MEVAQQDDTTADDTAVTDTTDTDTAVTDTAVTDTAVTDTAVTDTTDTDTAVTDTTDTDTTVTDRTDTGTTDTDTTADDTAPEGAAAQDTTSSDGEPASEAPAEPAAGAAVPIPTAPIPTAPIPAGPTPAGPTPAGPRPTPGGMRPRPGPPPPRPAASPVVDAGSALREAMAFGRVDDAGTVFVRTAAGEREVGTWAAGEPEAALAFFARRFATLESEVELAESRARAGALGADATVAVAARLAEQLTGAQVVGDLDGLSARIAELPELALERREQRKAERAAAAEQARSAKESVISEAEAIAQSDTWRAGPDRLRELFDVWRVLPRLDKATDDELWHRFSAARTTFTRRRKAHYNELAEARATIKAAKQELIAEAEKLASSTDWGPTTAAQRDLMNRWKQVGSASKDDDDALWARFHTIRQAFFDARAAHDEARSSGEKDNLAAKRAVLAEAEALLPVTDLKAARRSLRILRERWDAAGHVPRNAIAGLETRWKVVDEAVRGAEKTEWRRVDPEARRRAEQTAGQLRSSITKLEAEATRARDRGDARAAAQADEAVAARRAWLVQAEKLLAESS